MTINLKDLISNNWLDINNKDILLNKIINIQEYFIKQNSQKSILRVIIAETNNLDFIATFLAAILSNYQVFLANPHWLESEWKQVLDLVKPDLILGKEVNCNCTENNYNNQDKEQIWNLSSLIMIPTGGTSGKIKFAIHNLETLIASVKGFQDYFKINQINCLCVLPLYHVSGLMQLIRSLVTGGKLQFLSYKELKENPNLKINYADFFISLVPTQLQFLLTHNCQILSQFKTVLLGGAPACPSLLDNARKQNIKLALTYGMTETASQIVTLNPNDFLKGNQSNGKILPHAKITIIDHNGMKVKTNEIGIITIQSESLCLGYYPNLINFNPFVTDDLGYWDESGYLYIVGRNSHKIITGGYNVFPSEIEAAILDTNLVKDVAVIGIKDTYWGQKIVAFYVPKDHNINVTAIKELLATKISNYKQPKLWFSVEKLPRNQQGKLNYEQLQQLLDI